MKCVRFCVLTENSGQNWLTLKQRAKKFRMYVGIYEEKQFILQHSLQKSGIRDVQSVQVKLSSIKL